MTDLMQRLLMDELKLLYDAREVSIATIFSSYLSILMMPTNSLTQYS